MGPMNYNNWNMYNNNWNMYSNMYNRPSYTQYRTFYHKRSADAEAEPEADAWYQPYVLQLGVSAVEQEQHDELLEQTLQHVQQHVQQILPSYLIHNSLARQPRHITSRWRFL